MTALMKQSELLKDSKGGWMKTFLEILYISILTAFFLWLYWFWTGGWTTWVK